MRRRTPRSTLFPYTTLFRSDLLQQEAGVLVGERVVLEAAVGRLELPAVLRPLALLRRRVLHRVVAGVDEDLDRHRQDRKSTRLNSSHAYISYAVFCLKKTSY